MKYKELTPDQEQVLASFCTQRQPVLKHIGQKQITDTDLDKFRKACAFQLDISIPENFARYLDLEIDIEQYLNKHNVEVRLAEPERRWYRDNGATERAVVAKLIQGCSEGGCEVVCFKTMLSDKEKVADAESIHHVKLNPAFLRSAELANTRLVFNDPTVNNKLLKEHKQTILFLLNLYGFNNAKLKVDRFGQDYIDLGHKDVQSLGAKRLADACINLTYQRDREYAAKTGFDFTKQDIDRED